LRNLSSLIYFEHSGDIVFRRIEQGVSFRNTIQVLVITCNYPLNRTIGLLQRLYQPYFALTIFCGTWLPHLYDDTNSSFNVYPFNSGVFPRMLRPFNYIHLSKDEIGGGLYAYYCLSKVNDLRLENINGYFVMADDTTFNFWNEIELSVAFQAGDSENEKGGWYKLDVGLKAAKNVVSLFEAKYKNDTQLQSAWIRLGEGVGLSPESPT
ncbi:hypothetical protein COOONC_01419, partial [Cooperia oncophora]